MTSQASSVKITRPRTKPRTTTAGAATPAAQSRSGDQRRRSTPPPTPTAPKDAKAPEREQLRTLPRNDPRVPAAGTILSRTVEGRRCECRVEADGFRYAGELYESLSAAAAAAARDVGRSPSQNGFVFWGVVQPSAAHNPATSVAARWKHYETAVRRALERPGAEEIRRQVQTHLGVLRDVLGAGNIG